MNALFEEYSRLSSSFRHFLDSYKEKPEMELIHQLRLAVKKLRAVLKLVEKATSQASPVENHAALYNKLFKHAGAVREAQINETLVAAIPVADQGFKDHIANDLKNQLQRLSVSLQEFDLKELQEQDHTILESIKDVPDAQALQIARESVANLINTVHTLKKEMEDDKVLHKIRMHLKEVAELLSIIRKIQLDHSLLSFQEQIKSLNKVIGQWHDYAVLLDSIKNFYSEKSKPEKFGELEKLVCQKCAEQRNVIEGMLDKLGISWWKYTIHNQIS